jgi:hypothetical protein
MTYSDKVQRWEVEYTDEFEVWWDELSEDDQERIRAAVEILEQAGPPLDGRWWTRSTAHGRQT